MSELNVDTAGFMIMFVCAALLIVGASVPLILRRAKPNRWYGFRTSKTLADERVWYEANAYSGRLLCGLGVILALGSTALRFVPRVGTSLVTYSIVCSLLFTVGLLAVVGLSLRFVEEL